MYIKRIKGGSDYGNVIEYTKPKLTQAMNGRPDECRVWQSLMPTITRWSSGNQIKCKKNKDKIDTTPIRKLLLKSSFLKEGKQRYHLGLRPSRWRKRYVLNFFKWCKRSILTIQRNFTTGGDGSTLGVCITFFPQIWWRRPNEES